MLLFLALSMKKLTKPILIFAAAAAISFVAPASDHSDRPDAYFLNAGDVADSFLLLPPPPSDSSARLLYDVERYNWGRRQRDTDRGMQAVADANVDAQGVATAFSGAFGMTISNEATPQLYRLLSGMREDAGDLSTRSAKNAYMRTRPFALFGEDTCAPESQESLSKNGSYPSGHTAIGWATALVLAEINPARQNEILRRGFEIGESRVICGYHFQSDVDAARIVASAVVARLHADEEFCRQLALAKEEFKNLSTQEK